jgi:hypothetical protein
MKLLRRLSTLILIVSALLLSAASADRLETGHDSQPPKAKTKTGDKYSAPEPVSPHAEKPNPYPPTDKRDSETYNYYGHFSYVPPAITVSVGSDPWTIAATILLTIFTGALVVTSFLQWWAIGRQADLMQANFDQRIELANWRMERPRDHKVRIWVDLVNPTGFPLTITGSLAVGEKEQQFQDEILPPNTNSPKSIDFEISTASNEYAPIDRPVNGYFSHRHKITNKPVMDPWKGTLRGVWWGQRMHKWHVIFTRSATATKR